MRKNSFGRVEAEIVYSPMVAEAQEYQYNADLLQYKTLIRCIRDDYWTVLSAINKIKVIREEQIN